MNIYEHIFNLEKTVYDLKRCVRAWKCTKDLIDENDFICFVKGKIYYRVESSTTLTLKDVTGKPHILGDWEKYFKNVSV